MQPTISTFLWFESQAQAAAELYCSIFPNAKLASSSPGSSASFELDGNRYIAFNGGPHFKLTPAVSLFVVVETQAEIDLLWDRFIAAGAQPSQCGWLVDPFGLSWQILPAQLQTLLYDPDPAKAKRTFEAMLAMQKLDLAALQRANAGA